MYLRIDNSSKPDNNVIPNSRGTIVVDDETMLSSCGEGVREGSSSSTSAPSVWAFLSIVIRGETGSGLGYACVAVCMLKDDFMILGGGSVCML